MCKWNVRQIEWVLKCKGHFLSGTKDSKFSHSKRLANDVLTITLWTVCCSTCLCVFRLSPQILLLLGVNLLASGTRVESYVYLGISITYYEPWGVSKPTVKKNSNSTYLRHTTFLHSEVISIFKSLAKFSLSPGTETWEEGARDGNYSWTTKANTPVLHD